MNNGMNERVIKVKKKKLEFWLQEQERGTYKYIVYIYTVAYVVTFFYIVGLMPDVVCKSEICFHICFDVC